MFNSGFERAQDFLNGVSLNGELVGPSRIGFNDFNYIFGCVAPEPAIVRYLCNCHGILWCLFLVAILRTVLIKSLMAQRGKNKLAATGCCESIIVNRYFAGQHVTGEVQSGSVL